jgi:coproporphyrinogen III oxidase-like Fe-S oxidoreductase
MDTLGSFPLLTLVNAHRLSRFFFMNSICTFCNFNKYKDKEAGSSPRLLSAYLTELRTVVGRLHDNNMPRVSSIYFGGGTPSLAPISFFEQVLSLIRDITMVPTNLEVTIEVNPSSLSSALLSALQQLGVNRISLGVQSFNAQYLQMTNRDHTSNGAIESIALARTFFPGKVSCDLMFGMPNQSLTEWRADLNVSAQ